jgi:serine protease inhibitor
MGMGAAFGAQADFHICRHRNMAISQVRYKNFLEVNGKAGLQPRL